MLVENQHQGQLTPSQREVATCRLSRWGSGNAVKAPLLALWVALYPKLMALAGDTIWLLIHRHLVLALERSRGFLQWNH